MLRNPFRRLFLPLAAAAALLAACGETLDPQGAPAAPQPLFRFDTAPFPGDETSGAGDSGLSFEDFYTTKTQFEYTIVMK